MRWQWAHSGYGETRAQSLALPSVPSVAYHLRYPGQVDEGNGLFYNWHRFYHPASGRYVSADPIGLEGGGIGLGMWGGNPLGAVDATGLWSMNAHDIFIDQAFPHLSSPFREALKSGSAEADYIYNQGSTPIASARHAMSVKGQTTSDAKNLYCQFIKKQHEMFRNQLANARHQLARKATYAQLGRGMHAVMDSTSPAHKGFQTWSGDAKHHGPYVPFLHTHTPEASRHVGPYMEETTLLMNNYMSGNFGACGC